MKAALSPRSRPQISNSASDTRESFVIAYYRLDEASGDMVDEFANFGNLTTGADPDASQDLILQTGATGSREFDGSTHYGRSVVFDEPDDWHPISPYRVGTTLYMPNTATDFWMKPAAVDAQIITWIGGNSASETAATNCLQSVQINASSNIELYWEYGSGTDVRLDSGIRVGANSTVYVQASIDYASDADPTHCDAVVSVWSCFNTTSTRSAPSLLGTTRWQNQIRPTILKSSPSLYFSIGAEPAGGSKFEGILQDIRITGAALQPENGAFQALRAVATWDEEHIMGLRSTTHHLKVWIENSEGDMIDMTSLFSKDFVISARWSTTVDETYSTASIELARSNHSWSLAPENADSVLNQDSGFVFDPHIELNRKVSIQTATLPAGITPLAGHFVGEWDGIITDIDFGTPVIRITACDKGYVLDSAWVETEEIYGFLDGSTIYRDTTKGNKARLNSIHNAELDDTIHIANTSSVDAANPYKIQEVGDGYVIIDVVYPAVTETCTPLVPPIQELNKIINNASRSERVITRETDLDWIVTAWKGDVGPLLPSLDAIAAQIGDGVKYVWSDFHKSHNLEWYRIDRAATTMATITADQYIDINRAATSLANIRNVCQVSFGDREDPSGLNLQRPINSYQGTDSPSVTRYGRRWCSLHNVPNIDTATEATLLATSVISDLADPEILYTITLPYRRTVELGDLYTWEGNGVHFSEDTEMAIYGYEHIFSGGSATTVLSTRSKPCGRFKGWFRRFISPLKAKRPTVTVPPVVGFTASYNVINNTVSVQWTPIQQLSNAGKYRLFLYKSSVPEALDNPSRSTLHGEYLNNTAFVIIQASGLDDYYFKAVYVDDDNNFGPFTEAVYVDTTLDAHVLVAGAGSPYRNDLSSASSPILLLDENTVAVTEYTDTGTIFTKTDANGRFTLPHTANYTFNVQYTMTDFSATLGRYAWVVVRHYNSGHTLLNTYNGTYWNAPALNTGTPATYTATIGASATDYLTFSVGAGGSSYTFDINTAVVDIVMATS